MQQGGGATLMAIYAFGFTYIVFSIVNSIRSMRVSKEVELEFGDVDGLLAGSDVVVEGERIVLLPKTYTLDELMRVLPKPKVRLSLSDMDQVIRNRATKRARSR